LGAPVAYERLLLALDRRRPGFGFETDGTGPIELAMAYGLVAWAGAIASDAELSRRAAQWLLRNSRTSTGVGWGLGWEWDAFGDGTVNRADAIYGITTAIAVIGLVKNHELTGSRESLNEAIQALDYYQAFSTPTKEGLFFWYSDQAADAINVHNVSAMMAGAYALVARASKRSEFSDFAAGAFAELMASAESSKDALGWRYADLPAARPNDLVHAAYIAYGALLASRSLPSLQIDQHRLLNYLRGFISNGIPMEFRPDDIRAGLRNRRARSWGVGMLAFTLFELGAHEEARTTFAAASDYEFAPNQYSYMFGDKLNTPRSTAHLLLAAAVSA
jgi:hypothetical protein